MPLRSDVSWIYGMKALVAVPVVLSNASLVYVTAKTKTLRGTCNVLLAALSASIALYAVTFYVQFTVSMLMTDPNGIPLALCFVCMAVPIFFQAFQYVLFPMVALDRLLGALFPMWHLAYIQPNKRRYICAMFGTALAFATVVVGASAKRSLLDSPQALVLCITPDPTPAFYSYTSLVMNIVSVVCYVALWIRVHFWLRNDENSDNKFTRDILKSLMAVFLVEMFGWVFNTTVSHILDAIPQLDPKTNWYIGQGLGFMTLVTLGMNAPLLYIMSSEYRKAMFSSFKIRRRPQNPNTINTIFNNKAKSSAVQVTRWSTIKQQRQQQVHPSGAVVTPQQQSKVIVVY